MRLDRIEHAMQRIGVILVKRRDHPPAWTAARILHDSIDHRSIEPNEVRLRRRQGSRKSRVHAPYDNKSCADLQSPGALASFFYGPRASTES
jgi:hypothetical protein